MHDDAMQQSCMQICNTHMRTHTHALVHAHAHARTHTHIHTHTHTYAHPQSHTQHTLSLSRSRALFLSHTHTRTHIHTHTHTHTQAMRYLQIALHILPAKLLQGQLATDVLRRALALNPRPQRIESLLILFWRIVWGGEGEGGGGILHSDVIMEVMQQDPDGNLGVLPEIVIAYAQACLLLPPPRCAALLFDESRSV